MQDANSFLYGYTDRYGSNLPSFKDEIFPKILENYLKSAQNGIEKHGKQYFQEEMNILYGIESLHRKLPILKSYIQADFAFSPYMILDINPRHYDKKLNEYKQKGGILALLVTLKRPHDACLEELIEILDFVKKHITTLLAILASCTMTFAQFPGGFDFGGGGGAGSGSLSSYTSKTNID